MESHNNVNYLMAAITVISSSQTSSSNEFLFKSYQSFKSLLTLMKCLNDAYEVLERVFNEAVHSENFDHSPIIFLWSSTTLEIQNHFIDYVKIM